VHSSRRIGVCRVRPIRGRAGMSRDVNDTFFLIVFWTVDIYFSLDILIFKNIGIPSILISSKISSKISFLMLFYNNHLLIDLIKSNVLPSR
jgi:hypothetical protein